MGSRWLVVSIEEEFSNQNQSVVNKRPAIELLHHQMKIWWCLWNPLIHPSVVQNLY